MLFTWAVGHLVTAFSYTPVFVLMACLHPVAMLLVWLTARENRLDEARAAATTS